MVAQPTVLQEVPKHLRGNQALVHPTDKIMVEAASMPLRLDPARPLMDLPLLLAPELQPGSGRQEAHQLLDQVMTHPLQEDRMTTFRLHTVALQLRQLRLRLRDTETK